MASIGSSSTSKNPTTYRSRFGKTNLDALSRVKKAGLVVVVLGAERLMTPGARYTVVVDEMGEGPWRLERGDRQMGMGQASVVRHFWWGSGGGVGEAAMFGGGKLRGAGPTKVHVGPLVVNVVALPHFLGAIVLKLDRVHFVDVFVNQAPELGGLAAPFRGDSDHVDKLCNVHAGRVGDASVLEHLLRAIPFSCVRKKKKEDSSGKIFRKGKGTSGRAKRERVREGESERGKKLHLELGLRWRRVAQMHDALANLVVVQDTIL